MSMQILSKIHPEQVKKIETRIAAWSRKNSDYLKMPGIYVPGEDVLDYVRGIEFSTGYGPSDTPSRIYAQALGIVRRGAREPRMNAWGWGYWGIACD